MLKKIVGTIWKNLTPYIRLKIIRTTQHKFTVSAAAVVINEKQEILLLDHVLRHSSGWGIPGGFVGRGEQPADAVKREIFEETGLEIRDLELFRVRTINRHIEIIFGARATGKAEVKSREIIAAGWFEVDKMPAVMDEAQKSVVRKVWQNK